MRCTVDVVNILNACAIVKSLLNYFLLRVRVTVPARLNEAACAGIPQVSPATGMRRAAVYQPPGCGKELHRRGAQSSVAELRKDFFDDLFCQIIFDLFDILLAICAPE